MRQNTSAIQRLLKLAWPVMLEELFTTIVQYIDVAMVGRIGAAASAAVGLTSTVTWLVNAPLWAIGTGVLAVVSREFGAGNHGEARKAAIQSLWLSLLPGFILMAITMIIGPFLPVLMGAEEAIRKPASQYFIIICLPMVFRSLTIVLSSTLRAVQDTKTPMRVSVLVNLINIVLNAVLIFPSGFIAPFIPGMNMGVAGAAIATAISFTSGGIFILFTVWHNPVISPKGCSLRPDRSILRKCIRITIPAAATRVVSCFGHVVFSAQVTHLGTQALAAHTLALTAEQGFYIPGYGIQAAVSSLCGSAAGAKNEHDLRHICRSGILLSAGIMCVTGGILYLIPGQMMLLFTQDAGVIADGSMILKIVALSEPFFGAAIILEGVFDGIGDTQTPFLYSLISMWGVRIFLTHICLSIFHLYLDAVWDCMVLGNIVYLLLLSIHYRRNRWLKYL